MVHVKWLEEEKCGCSLWWLGERIKMMKPMWQEQTAQRRLITDLRRTDAAFSVPFVTAFRIRFWYLLFLTHSFQTLQHKPTFISTAYTSTHCTHFYFSIIISSQKENAFSEQWTTSFFFKSSFLFLFNMLRHHIHKNVC